MRYTNTIRLLIAASLSVFPALAAAQSQTDGIQVSTSGFSNWLKFNESPLGAFVDFSKVDKSALSVKHSAVEVNKSQVETEVGVVLAGNLANKTLQGTTFYSDKKVESLFSTGAAATEVFGRNENVPASKYYLDIVDKQKMVVDGRGTVLGPNKYLMATFPAIQQLEHFITTPKPEEHESSMLKYVDSRGTVLAPQHILVGNTWAQDLKTHTFN